MWGALLRLQVTPTLLPQRLAAVRMLYRGKPPRTNDVLGQNRACFHATPSIKKKEKNASKVITEIPSSKF